MSRKISVVAVIAAVIAFACYSSSSAESKSVLLWKDEESGSLPDVSFLDDVLGGRSRDKEAAKKIEQDRILVDAAQLQMKKKIGPKTVAGKKGAIKRKVIHILRSPDDHKAHLLRVLGVKKASLARLSKSLREQFKDGELREREKEISEELHEKNQEQARELTRRALRAELKKVRKETSADLSQIQHDKDDASWSDDDYSVDATGGSKESARQYQQEEGQIRRQLEREGALHDDDDDVNTSKEVTRSSFKDQSKQILNALKKDSSDIKSQVHSAVGH